MRATNLGSSLLTLVCVVLTQVGTKQSTQTINQSGQVKATNLGCSLLTLVSSPSGHMAQVAGGHLGRQLNHQDSLQGTSLGVW